MTVSDGTLVSLLARLNPLEFFRRIREVPMIAFSISSSNATLPATMETAVLQSAMVRRGQLRDHGTGDAARRRRSRAPLSLAAPGGSRLMATRRLSVVSRAFQTSPKPPLPILSRIS